MAAGLEGNGPSKNKCRGPEIAFWCLDGTKMVAACLQNLLR